MSGDRPGPLRHQEVRAVGIRRQLSVYRTRILVVISVALIAAVATYLLTSAQQKVYEAKATLIVGQSLSSVNPDYNQLLASQRLSTTYASVVTTRPVLEAVISKLGLNTTPDDLRPRVVADTSTD